MPKSLTEELVQKSLESKPAELAEIFENLMLEKITEKIAEKQIEVGTLTEDGPEDELEEDSLTPEEEEFLDSLTDEELDELMSDLDTEEDISERE